MNYQQLFLEHLGLIGHITRFVARRHHLSAQDHDDFRGLVHLKLVEHDYAILRKFEGRSALATFLTTVIARMFLDYRNAQWGKWRPSAAARRLGQVAMWLEQMTSRDGMSFDAAVQTLRTNHHIQETDAELAEIKRWLSTRVPRRQANEDELEGIASAGAPVDEALKAEERASLCAKVQRALSKVLDGLAPQDRLILEMLFLDDFQLSLIARKLGLEQKPLYRRRYKLMLQLRTALEAEGLSQEDVLSLLGAADVDLGAILERRRHGNT